MNQGRSYQPERDGNYIWAPKTNRAGNPVEHHVRLREVGPGEVIVHYAGGKVVAISLIQDRAVSADKPSELPGDWGEMIYFTRQKPHPYDPDWYAPAHAFPTERALQRFLIQNFDRIPASGHLKRPEPEYELPSGKRIDILCRERHSNDYVVIELKKRAQDPIGQLERYLNRVNKRLAQKETPKVGVQGIIITGTPNAALERELSELIQDYPVVWLVYRAQIELYERIRVP